MMFSVQGSTGRSEPSENVRGKRYQFPVGTKLSAAAARHLLDAEQDGAKARTIADLRVALWYLIEFLGSDPELGQLPEDVCSRWLAWLRDTPIAAKKSGQLPSQITAETVTAFFAWPPRRMPGDVQFRGEQTIGRFWRTLRPFFKRIGIDTDLAKRERPNLDLPPPLVPEAHEIAGQWQTILANEAAKRKDRRRVLLMQALHLLTGMRSKELLEATLGDVEGNWLLLRDTKTGQRIIFLSGQALAIADALRERMLWTDSEAPFAGWRHSQSMYCLTVRSCWPASAGPGPHKPQQSLRSACSNYMAAVDPVAEAAQLGHGGMSFGLGGAAQISGVVFRHYVDVLARIPPVLAKFRLPEIDGFHWPEPLPTPERPPKPVRLYEVFRRLVGARRA